MPLVVYIEIQCRTLFRSFFGAKLVEGGACVYGNPNTLVLLEHGGQPHVLPIAVRQVEGTTLRNFYFIGFCCGRPPTPYLKVIRELRVEPVSMVLEPVSMVWEPVSMV